MFWRGVQQLGWGLGVQDRLLLQPQARVLRAEWGNGCVVPVAGDVTGINTDRHNYQVTWSLPIMVV